MNLYDMNLGDDFKFADDSYALRVPGGWVFTTYRKSPSSACAVASCFVPYDDEFQWTSKSSGEELE